MYKVENVYGYGNNSRSRCVVEINGVSNMILSESRDDLGRLTALRKGSDSREGRYTYNVRSQLTEIRWDNPAINFAQRLYYTSEPGTPRYNGFISAMAWKIGRGDNRIRGYRYTYNLMGWLTEAAYGENESLGTNPNRYTERVLEYTANGVIKRFQRHGLKDDGIYGKIDNLHLQLDGNYITGVTDDAAPVTRYANADIHPSADAGTHYLYDTSGALTRDLDRGVELIEYDLADNPQRIIFTSGAQTRYVYTPSGQKVRTIHLIPDVSLTGQATKVVADTTDYVGSIVYRGGAAEMLCFEGGYATFAQGSDPEYHYYVTDYQGNHRGVFSGSTGEMEQVTHYYPFGAVYADRGRGASLQPYKHGGKELDLMHGLYHYDYLARPYDPLLCIFTSPDSRATSYPHLHPRAFCANNPINYIDPDGNSTYVVYCNDKYEVIDGDLEDDDLGIYIVSDKNHLNKNLKLGVSTSISSFYDSGDVKGGKGAGWTGYIDKTDGSGTKFFEDLKKEDPTLLKYAYNARSEKPYDFKSTNGTGKPIPNINHYRGMPFGTNSNNENIYTSARDIGNICAGYVSGAHLLPWTAHRLGADLYQWGKEGMSSVNAQRYGWELGIKEANVAKQALKLSTILISPFASPILLLKY